MMSLQQNLKKFNNQITIINDDVLKVNETNLLTTRS